jgi:hypothetical protein
MYYPDWINNDSDIGEYISDSCGFYQGHLLLRNNVVSSDSLNHGDGYDVAFRPMIIFNQEKK